ncbi:acetate/propionate family kinase [Legionella quateirensis]|uniref:Acetate kinase n=1 Tax=Legionella quateirensis TaxID=45072 RepID=A0A378P9Y1_9GAMM|nr:acetate/propionate family kinase [Legionella quateirensis]KTD53897.1 acetate kinase [Legionella quateirensis]STY83052.1 Acetate kinase (Acetokinase) [Legionella quateirensis]
MTAIKAASILVINVGSSSVKFQLFSRQLNPQLLVQGKVADIGGRPSFIATDTMLNPENKQADKKILSDNCSHEEALHRIWDWIEEWSEQWQVTAVAHRIVHGGTLFKSSVLINPHVMQKLWALAPLAPLHQPHNLKAIEFIGTLKPEVLQIACFDTAFHTHHKALFTEYALPQKIREQGVRRYGFHGLSYEWIVHTLRRYEPSLAEGRLIAAHLGNGASLCAIHHGISVDTTMGMTALDGLPMGTRCGSLDAGAVTFMIRHLGLSIDEIESLLYNESGLLGLSGLSNDVKVLQGSKDTKAQFALEYFCLKVAQFMGMMAVTLGGVDAIVFTGGIGENSAFVRSTVLRHVTFLKPFETRVVAANEERMMALHAMSLLERQTGIKADGE